MTGDVILDSWNAQNHQEKMKTAFGSRCVLEPLCKNVNSNEHISSQWIWMKRYENSPLSIPNMCRAFCHTNQEDTRLNGNSHPTSTAIQFVP